MKKIAYSIFLIGVSVLATAFFMPKHVEYLHVKILPDGSTYEGEFDKEGRFSGNGKLQWENGSYFEGEFLKGAIHGKGSGYLAGSGKYSGAFSHGLMEGMGKWEMVDGSRYEGEIHKDQMHGKGKFIYSSGEIYEGDFVEGIMQGNGKWIYPNGDHTEGQMKNGKLNGYGKLFYGGDAYEGELVDGNMHGQGKYENEFQSYTGEFRDGYFHGEGVLTNLESGEVITGYFKNGSAEGKGSKVDKKGNQWQGNFEDNYLSGKGSYKGADGEEYRGNFEYGEFSGKGKLVEKNGDIYTGSFSFGKKHGKGELIFAKPVNNQSRLEGTWVSGKLVKASGAYRVYDAEEISEYAIYDQHDVLVKDLNAVVPSTPKTELYSLVVAGYGSQEVFNRELNYVREFFDKEFSNSNRSVFLSNSRYELNHALATKNNIEQSMQSIAKKMDLEKDILFMYLTSHGSKDGKFSLDHVGIDLKDMPAEWFAKVLQESKIKNKVLVISACYSGKFIDHLKDDHTLILTAAATDRRSFGCSDDRNFTYFGEAYFKKALHKTRDFERAFVDAKTYVAEWEQKEKQEGDKSSNPQIYVGSQVRGFLDRWNWGKPQD